MISIIVCSINKQRLENLQANLAAFCTTDYELIAYRNVQNEGLCQVYNKCAAKAKHNTVCFLHEDVLFHTKGWDEKIINALIDKNIGVIGVMGGRYKSAFGLGWRDGKTDFYRFRSMSGLENGKLLYYNPGEENLSQVVCLDGAFLCCRKDLWQQFLFDEINFKGFHFYDTDFTFRVAQKFKNFVINDLLLEHFSQGNFNTDYLLDSIVFEEKHHQLLPFTIEHLSQKEISHLEGYALTEKLTLMKRNGFSFSSRLNIIGKYFVRYFNFYQLIRNLYFGIIKA